MSELDSSGHTPGGTSEPPAPQRRGLNYRPINWLLVVPLIGTLFPAFFNFRSPSIGGMPFFYWYQLAWVPVGVVCTLVVYRSTRGER